MWTGPQRKRCGAGEGVIDYLIINGTDTSNKSLSAIVMSTSPYIGFEKYARHEDFSRKRGI